MDAFGEILPRFSYWETGTAKNFFILLSFLSSQLERAKHESCSASFSEEIVAGRASKEPEGAIAANVRCAGPD